MKLSRTIPDQRCDGSRAAQYRHADYELGYHEHQAHHEHDAETNHLHINTTTHSDSVRAKLRGGAEEDVTPLSLRHTLLELYRPYF